MVVNKWVREPGSTYFSRRFCCRYSLLSSLSRDSSDGRDLVIEGGEEEEEEEAAAVENSGNEEEEEKDCAEAAGRNNFRNVIEL